MVEDSLQKQLREWRASRAPQAQRAAASDRRTVRVNGQEVVVVRKKPKPRADE